MDPNSFRFILGLLPGHGSATVFPVRSHHLSGLLEDSG